MKKYFETGLMILCAAGFFGFIYPELCLTTDTVKVAESEVAPVTERELIRRIYDTRITLPPPQARLRFRLLEIAKGQNNAR